MHCWQVRWKLSEHNIYFHHEKVSLVAVVNPIFSVNFSNPPAFIFFIRLKFMSCSSGRFHLNGAKAIWRLRISQLNIVQSPKALLLLVTFFGTSNDNPD